MTTRLIAILTLLLVVESPAQVQFKKLVLSDQFFSEGANAADFNNDGKMDVVSGPFWYEGPDFTKRHQYGPGDGKPLDPHGYSKNFLAFTDDINHDGKPDILIVGFPGEAALWYENPGGTSDQRWAEHVVIDHCDNESPGFEDVNGDGKRDLICITGTQFGWAERDSKSPNAPWRFHPVSVKNPAYQRFTHGIGLGDVNGDGRVDMLDKDGWWEQPEKLDGDPTWTKHEFKFADGGSQMFAIDVNGDKRADVISSFNAHGFGLNWFEQTDAGKFAKHPILGASPKDNPQGVCFSQLHSVALADINGDGLTDIVTGKRWWAHGPDHDPEPNAPAVLYWFEAHKNADAPGGIEFIPHQIDDNSGVGTQVVVSDMNGDGKPDIIVGNKKGTFVFLQESLPNKAMTQSSNTTPHADPFAENIRSTDALAPEQERLALHVPPGFEVQLVASEPDIAKPLNFAFDARGRMWVTETVEYPFPAKDRKGQDRIRIIEIGADGHATKISTFAEGLSIPIGIYPYKDGCIAFSTPEIRRYFDDDGDGKSDRSELLYGTFGSNDTHGMTNAFRRGFDGWLYACHGFNNHSQITASDGSLITLESGNTYRMKVDGSHVEQFTWGQTNPYGLCFDPLGNLYSSDSHSKPIYQLIRGGYYEGIGKVDDGLGLAPAMMQHSHGSTAIAGVLYYAAEQFPSEWRGNMFGGNVVTGRINHDTITYAGSSPIAHEAPDFLKSDDPWFRPVDVQMGPDGAMYVADFYNRIIGHYEVPLDNPRRDHQRGRIWRIVYRGNPSPPPRDLRSADVDALIAALGDSNLVVRRIASDELCDRIGDKAIEPVKQLLLRSDVGAIQAVHAMWVLYRLGALDRSMLATAAHATDVTIHIHALRILAETTDWDATDRELAVAALKDENALVRRCSADALGQHPAIENIPPLLQLLSATSADDFQLRYDARVALRNQMRETSVIAKLDSLNLNDDQLKQVLNIMPAVSSSAAAGFEIAHLNLVAQDNAAANKLLRHAVKYAADAQTTDAAVTTVRKVMADDLELQLELFAAIRQTGQERGGEMSTAVREWGRDIATRTLRAPGTNACGWRPIVTGLLDRTPWTPQRRKSADGNADAWFWSSLPKGETLVGALSSESFTIPPTLSFYIAGHNGIPGAAPRSRNVVRLCTMPDHHTVMEASVPRNDLAQQVTWDLHEFAGRAGIMEAFDNDQGTAYAWIAFGRFAPPVITVPARCISDASCARAAEVAELLKLPALSDDLWKTVDDPFLVADARCSAWLALASFGDEKAMRSLVRPLMDGNVAWATRDRIVRKLGAMNSRTANETVFKLLDELISLRRPTFEEQVLIARSFVQSASGAAALLDGVSSGRVGSWLLTDQIIRDAIIASNVENASARVAELTKGLPSPKADLARTIAQRGASFSAAAASGRAAADRGEKVFAATCMACHQIDGTGKQVGPQLDGIGARGADRVIEDVLDPSRNVDPAFRYTTLVLKGGDVVTGLYRREEPGGFMIFVDATGREVPVEKAKIQRRIDSNASLMPDNFADAIKPDDFNDLIEFLLSHRNKSAK